MQNYFTMQRALGFNSFYLQIIDNIEMLVDEVNDTFCVLFTSKLDFEEENSVFIVFV